MNMLLLFKNWGSQLRNRFADVFYELAKEDERLCMLVADISPAGSIEKFRTHFPDRFVNTGVAEQIMIGMAAGMAQRGMRPFAYTIATFALYRPFEFIRNDICYQDLPVTIVGIGGGLNYSTLGTTHHAIEDIAIASSISGMQVIAPCDPDEVEAATAWCATQNNGPVYLRLGKAGEPNLTALSIEPWTFGKWRKIESGDDLAILTYGTLTKLGVDLNTKLKERGISSDLYSLSTLKPFDESTLGAIFSKHNFVIVIEEHIRFGGVGMQVQAKAHEFGWNGNIESMSLDNSFVHIYGNYQELLNFYFPNSETLANRIALEKFGR
jgi:transketolase